ncbi:glycerol-3-phosphate dehydrogenase [Uliginosibacterium sp. H3]|uniref:Glycerol-3-phosphate dehydrogenase n=1 Tax=Uliginosibacterium silvisoli TaxID=3114758 RepID=A0ABU6K108_9RHOO|nr:glycerol-3-phosphate dehydrogenase [Uliginosibacterium sp. H3]
MTDLSSTLFDLVVVGGGINGAGIARDAAGRGLKVLLVEREDLAQHTSSASTKLIHGGLRYLENFEFSLVRKALAERETLLNAAPHITWPLRFVMPHDDAIRSRWLVRAGLFFYDHLARRDRLPASEMLDLSKHPAGSALQAQWQHAFEYSDAWVDDARLVVLNCVDAAERGATVLTRTACTRALRGEDGWQIGLRDDAGIETTLHARALINATGPWVASFLRDTGQRPRHRVRLVRGSHIVVPRLFAHDKAYLFQNPDRRIVFAIPYERDFTLIGTTETTHATEASAVHISAEETDYLCATASRFFREPVTPEQVRWSFSGLRPLLDDEHAALSRNTRDYLLELDGEDAPLLSVFGGKITTYRKLAEEAVGRIQNLLGHHAPDWTARAPLPGGDMADADFARFRNSLSQQHRSMPEALIDRLAHAYGTRCRHILGGAAGSAALGEEILPGLFEREVDYLIAHEWARTATDILWRRSKLGLHLQANATQLLDAWLEARALNPRS